MFRGIHSVIVDAKGRINLPVKIRRLMISDEMDKTPDVIVTIDTDSPCLLLYPTYEWELIEEKLRALPSFNPATRRIQRLLIGYATDISFDSNQRILLPELLRNYANLDKKIKVVGQGKKLELWNAEHWDEHQVRWLEETAKSSELPDELKLFSL